MSHTRGTGTRGPARSRRSLARRLGLATASPSDVVVAALCALSVVGFLAGVVRCLLDTAGSTSGVRAGTGAVTAMALACLTGTAAAFLAGRPR